MDDQTVLMQIITEMREDMKTLRDSSTSIKDELSRLGNMIDLLRAEQANEKDNTRLGFERVHKRIDDEASVRVSDQKEIQATIKELETKIAIVTPKAQRFQTVFDWVARSIIMALVGGMLWALTQFMGDK